MKTMIKTALITAILTSISAGAFAAANPFSDVPRSSWAYDAVQILAKDGVISGYGDDTFQGDRAITRYEMAQMTAKAMAKEQVSAKDQVTIEKLSAEFADELSSLGVRVSALEAKTDNVKFSGFYRLRAERFMKGASSIPNTVKSYFEVYTDAKINDTWTAKSKAKIESDMDKDSDATNTMTNVYAEGKLSGIAVKVGKFDTVDGYAYTHEDPMSGVQLSFGNKLKTRLSGGRISNPNNYFSADYGAAELSYKLNKATNLTGAYHVFRSVNKGYKTIKNDDFELGNIGFDTLFAKNLRFVALYAKSDANASVADTGYFTELDYKYMDVNRPGSFMIMLRNFKLTDATAISSRYDSYTHGNVKGTELGICYAPVKNVETGLKYFWGKDVNSNIDKNFFRGEIKFFF